jgi:CAAX amino terminal protease family protein
MGIVEKRYISHIRELRALGFLGWASPLKFVTCLVIAPVSFVVFVFGSLYLAVTFGLLDVTAGALTSALKAAMASTYSPYGWLPYLVLAVGAELGWRGWLLPHLLPLGRVPAIVVSGIIWGLSYSPLIYLGYLYHGISMVVSLVTICGMGIVVGGVLAWLRLYSDSLWPPVVAHTVLTCANSAVLIAVPMLTGDQPTDMVQFTIFGWSGWILPGLLLVVLLSTGRFPAQPPGQATNREDQRRPFEPEQSPYPAPTATTDGYQGR